MSTFRTPSNAPRAKVALLYGAASAAGALAMFLLSRAQMGHVLQIAVLALVMAGFAFATWIVSGRLCSLASASSQLEMSKTIESMVGKRTAHLEAANAELASQARTDPLTGLLNRRGFDSQAKVALAQARRRGSALSVMVLDIDHFKRINDKFGHPVGDKVIKALADTLVLRLRDSDVIARIGGEEFAIILSDTSSDGAVVVAKGIVKAIEAMRVPVVGAFTVSAGVALARLAGDKVDTVATVIERADEALYMAKDQGRNQVCIQELLVDLSPMMLAAA